LSVGERYGGLAADPLNFPAAETIVVVTLDPLKIGGNHLKLQAGASRVYDQNIHLRDFGADSIVSR
jgi:hypothetical protein